MADKSHLKIEAAAWKELAERARRLAGSLLDGPDREQLLKYSAELEQKAAGLKGEALPQPPVVDEALVDAPSKEPPDK
jgi:hypothetical protein